MNEREEKARHVQRFNLLILDFLSLNKSLFLLIEKIRDETRSLVLERLVVSQALVPKDPVTRD